MIGLLTGLLSRKALPWIGAGLGVLAVVILYASWSVTRSRLETERFKSSMLGAIADNNAQVAKAKDAQLEIQATVSREMQTRIVTITKAGAVRVVRLKEADRADPIVHDWNRQPIPDAVRRVHSDPDGAPAGPVVPAG